jgi:hypothetical protein
VRVKDDGTLGYHVWDNWEGTCKGFKTKALWTCDNKLNAFGRSSDGICMKCGEHADDGENLGCTQCCFETRNSQDST